MVNKRFAMVVGMIATVVLAFGGTASAHNDDDNGWTVTVTHNPVNWVLASGHDPGQCPNLPDGIVLTGVGQEVFTSKRRTDRWGITHLHDTSIKQGSVTDNAGNTYRFDYINTAWSISRDGENFRGIMFDVFSVKGRGPGTLRNGFLAQIEFGADYFRADPISEFGNPFAFPSGPGICDPI